MKRIFVSLSVLVFGLVGCASEVTPIYDPDAVLVIVDGSTDSATPSDSGAAEASADAVTDAQAEASADAADVTDTGDAELRITFRSASTYEVSRGQRHAGVFLFELEALRQPLEIRRFKFGMQIVRDSASICDETGLPYFSNVTVADRETGNVIMGPINLPHGMPVCAGAIWGSTLVDPFIVAPTVMMPRAPRLFAVRMDIAEVDALNRLYGPDHAGYRVTLHDDSGRRFLDPSDVRIVSTGNFLTDAEIVGNEPDNRQFFMVEDGACHGLRPETLFQASSSTTLAFYLGRDCHRYAFPPNETFLTWYPDTSNVITVSDAMVAAIPIGGNIMFRPGTWLVRLDSDTSTRVYAVTGCGTLRWIENESTIAELYGSDWRSRVHVVTSSYVPNYTVGPAITIAVHPDGTLITYAGSPDIYVVQNGQRHLFLPGAFAANGFQPMFIITTTIAYPDGAPVTGLETALSDPSCVL